MRRDELDVDELIGAMYFQGAWRFFAETVAEWILDYTAYDPTFDPANSTTVFRGNVLTVTRDTAAQFCAALTPYELDATDIQQLVARRPI